MNITVTQVQDEQPITVTRSYKGTVDESVVREDGYKFTLSHVGHMNFINCYLPNGSFSHEIMATGSKKAIDETWQDIKSKEL